MSPVLASLLAALLVWGTRIEWRVRHPRDRQKTTEGIS